MSAHRVFSLLWHVDSFCRVALAATYVNWIIIFNSHFETYLFVEILATLLLTSTPLLVLVTAIISYRTHEDRQRAAFYATALFIVANIDWIALLQYKGMPALLIRFDRSNGLSDIILSSHHIVIWASLALLFSFFIDLALEQRWTPLAYATHWFWKLNIRENAERDSNHIWAIYARRYDPRKTDTVQHGTSQSFDAQHPLLRARETAGL